MRIKAMGLVLLAVMQLTLVTASAHAQAPEPTPANMAQARALFATAVEHMSARRWTDASATLTRALSLHDAPTVRWNLAACEYELGHLVEAAGHLRAVANAEGADEALRARARIRLDEVEARVAFITVEVEEVHGLHVRLDGELMPTAGLGIARPVDPGTRQLTADAPGRRAFETELAIEEGESRTIRVDLPRIPNVLIEDWVARAAEVAGDQAVDPGGLLDLSAEGSGGEDVTEQWWFWTGLGTLAVGIVASSIAAFAASATGGSDLPGGAIETRSE